jgi:hypothetical protein
MSRIISIIKDRHLGDFEYGTPDTRMLNVPGADKWRKERYPNRK